MNTIAEALAQPQFMARDMIGEIEHEQYGTIRFIKSPLKFSDLDIQYKLAPPILGEHKTNSKSPLYKNKIAL